MTVDVIAHIFSFMALQKPKSEGKKLLKRHRWHECSILARP